MNQPCISEAHPSTGHGKQKLGAWSTLHNPAGCLTHWRVSFKVTLNLSRETCLVPVSSRQGSGLNLLRNLAHLRMNLSSLYCLLWSGSAIESSQFQGLPGAILSCLPLCLKSFSGGWDVSVWKATVTQYSTPSSGPSVFPIPLVQWSLSFGGGDYNYLPTAKN